MGTSSHRAGALERLGHQVVLRDPYAALGWHLENRWTGAGHHRTGYRLLQRPMEVWAKGVIESTHGVDLIWVDSGELMGPKVVSALRLPNTPLVLYNVDDPTGVRDGRRFDSLLSAIPLYDLCVVVRDVNVEECRSRGARKAMKVWRSYDEVAHCPDLAPTPVPGEFCADVSFIGTWMRHEARDKLLLSLRDRGLEIAVWGDRWDRSPLWSQLLPYWRGPSLAGGDYVSAIRGARICLGLLSAGNRDLHTQRSLEIPYAGGLLCAQRTSEHLELYIENEEAVFWSSVDECAATCQELLADPERRERIRTAGMRRIRQNGLGNEDICRQILAAVSQ